MTPQGKLKAKLKILIRGADLAAKELADNPDVESDRAQAYQEGRASAFQQALELVEAHDPA